ncbi:GATOR complex protein Iml1 [Daphnia magna]|uniref:GATOR complex protein Iml1 n=1 Tax=Daphnia magna TaxID=35525 RepID=UPI001E1BA454|nr:GATOR complex protein Iml1 [Daphnia magna]
MKTFKLIAHQKHFSEEEIILSSKDFPQVKVRDVVEIYHPDVIGSRILLQVHSLKDDIQTKDTISIEQSIVSLFQLQIFFGVHVTVVDPTSAALDSVELTFKDQYLGRSDMWRLKNCLIGTCLYIGKKLEFCSKSVRCQVHEMWGQGERVACGVITEDTKIVFRSSTSQVYLFLQMSSEMWDFDIYGDLYFEKAVNGFLSELFAKWKRHGSNHEVTIVLFSRIFYEAESLEYFPEAVRACLQQDYRGKFYEDFYRVAVQSERMDDWACILPQLKLLFHGWQNSVLGYHQQNHPGVNIPKGVNSCAAQGNFLEVLNMSLNVFEKHYLDRSFDRTGQLSVVITPGVGVFEVDRELTNITKQRIIDNGVGSDLVCVGEQPLHAVPLLQFHNKRHCAASNDFSMPHWINLSFYSSSKRIGYSTFLPRIKMAPILNKETAQHKNKTAGLLSSKASSAIKVETSMPNSVFDYDAYDAKVFALPVSRTSKVQTLMRESRHRKTTTISSETNRFDRGRGNVRKSRVQDADVSFTSGHPGDGLSSSLISAPTMLSCSLTKTPSVTIPKRSAADDSFIVTCGATAPHARVRRPSGGEERLEDRRFSTLRVVVGSAGSPCALGGNTVTTGANPSTLNFNPSTRQIKTGRALINPFDPSRVTIKLTSNRRRWTHIFPKGPTGVLIQQHHYQAVPASEEKLTSSSFGVNLSSANLDSSSVGGNSNTKGRQRPMNRSLTLLWGATGEQEWTPALTTGVDWKSLTIPACLPITTDYFPDQRSLQNDFLVSEYSIIPDDVNSISVNDCGQQQKLSFRRPLETKEVFLELISQRLSQGFQLIVLPHTYSTHSQEYLLSIGRIFHKIVLKGSTITVTGYRPRHPYPTCNIHYRYRLQTPDHLTYEISWVDFNAEKLENYNWNHLDHYICTRGDRDFALTESLKYWRLRLCVLPTYDCPFTEKILRFLDTCVNRVKHHNPTKKPRPLAPTMFRDRGGSNRIPDRPRPRASLVETKSLHQSSGDHGLSMADNQFSTDECIYSVTRTRVASGSAAIVEAMKSSIGGMTFLEGKINDLPPYTFISYEAVAWLLDQVEGITTERDAIELMQKMIDERHVCHSSGNDKIKFCCGFYLFSLVSDAFSPGCVSENFDCEWAEVEFENSFPPPCASSVLTNPEPAKYQFLIADPKEFRSVASLYENRYDQMLRYKSCNLDMDISGKSERIEWGHLRYQSVFYPDASLEFIFQWVVCTGPLVAELLQNWLRKAQNCGVNLVPIPCDPFALPMSHKADPLRAPVFVPLNISALNWEGRTFFEEYPQDSWPQRLLLFQESIARHFGFLPCSPDPASPTASSRANVRPPLPPLQFIHTSGTAFVLILSSTSNDKNVVHPSPQRPQRTNSNWLPNSAVHSPTDPSLTLSYITRHVVGRQKWQQNQEVRVGFLWAWNSMLSKRWRNPSGPVCDENTGSKLLSDFRKFCANDEDRLKNYWLQALDRMSSVSS